MWSGKSPDLGVVESQEKHKTDYVAAGRGEASKITFLYNFDSRKS